MPALSDDVKTFIVVAHACYRKPSLIKKDVKAEFEVEVSRQSILSYHPERGSKEKRLAQKWKTLFEKTRELYDEGKVKSGISRLSYRLDLYKRAADFYEEQGQYVLATDMAVKAAKDEGGFYTNRRELTGEGGKALLPDNIAGAILKVYGESGEEPAK